MKKEFQFCFGIGECQPNKCAICDENKEGDNLYYLSSIFEFDKYHSNIKNFLVYDFMCHECYDVLFEMIDEPKERMVMTVELPISARLVLGNKNPFDLIKILILGKKGLKK